MPRVAIRTLGCKVNRAESEALAEALLPLGIVVARPEDATDAVVVNTCTVTGEADAKARKEVRRALGSTSGPVIVTGCLAALDAKGLRALDARVVVEADRAALPVTVASMLGAIAGARAAAVLASDPAHASAPASPVRLAGSRTRALVKVEDGCDNRCAYCIVPDARGVPRSVPLHAVVERVEALHAQGVAEVVLTGVNLGRYEGGADAVDLAALVERLAATGVRRIRLSSIEPPDLTARLLSALAGTPAVAPHLHVPLQSGCDRILAAMGRRYDTAAFADALARARAALPGLAVTTDVIAGFPGESDEDFAATLAFCEACAFARLHVFRYSRRAGTPAATAPGQVPATVKAARAGELRALGADLERGHAHTRSGQEAWLLVEAVREGVAHGTTEDYLRVSCDLPSARPGDLVRVTLGVSDDGCVRGYYVGESRA